MGKNYQKKPNKQLDIAKQHVKDLFERAKETFKKDEEQAQRYIDLARKVAMKFKLKLPSENKRLYCKHCYRMLIPGKTLRVRVHEHRVIYYCLQCKKFWRKPLGKKTGKQRKRGTDKIPGNHAKTD